MTPERSVTLPRVPASIEDAHGHPRFGTYRGELDVVALERLRGPYALPLPLQLLKRKKWCYAQVVTPQVVAVFAVVDLGYTSNAFISVLDLGTQKAVFDDSFMGLPGSKVCVGNRPGSGSEALFRRPGVKLALRRAPGSDRYEVDVEVKPFTPFGTPLRWTGGLSLQGAGDALTVVSPVLEDGVVNVTQKRAGLCASGAVVVGRQRYDLDGGVAGLDYTHGYLARRTAWRWAMGNGRLPDGTAFGFNLVEGMNDSHSGCNENGIWVGGALHPVGRARFQFNKEDPAGSWRVETADGAVKLAFQPLHLHRERRDYKIVRSHFVQPLGLFSGQLQVGSRTLEVERAGGVTEDQDILW